MWVKLLYYAHIVYREQITIFLVNLIRSWTEKNTTQEGLRMASIQTQTITSGISTYRAEGWTILLRRVFSE